MAVFLSYSSRDRIFVTRLADELRVAGIEVWLDEAELRVGDSLSSIEKGIREARCLVVAWSAAAAESTWVEREIEFARKISSVRILPILLDDVAQPWEIVFADFRDGSRYRRTVTRLIHAINELPNPDLPRAKEAVLRVKGEFPLAGELFGVSQQGVGTIYHLANLHDWIFADASMGESRFWIVEMYQRRDRSVHPFAVMDGVIHELPVLYLLDADPEPVANSVTVFSCALNHLPGISEEEAQSSIAEHGSKMQRVARRYTRFRPVLLMRPFVDSDAAVAAALDVPQVRQLFRERAQDLFTLTKLECDKQHGNALLWKISFFEESLGESVLTVGVDAVRGTIRYPAMRAELLNADFLTLKRDDDGNIVMNISNQLRAMESHVWDIAVPGDPSSPRLTAAEALRLGIDSLGAGAGHWQLGFLSNTGVVQSVASSHLTPHDALMRADGTAGQWVIEFFGTTGTPVTEETRQGFAYDYRVVVVTRAGVETVDAADTCALTAPLVRSPLPTGFGKAIRDIYENAHELALQSVSVEFELMSVALDRPSGGACWRFRFYDLDEIVARVWVSADGTRVIGP